ncbi:MAG: TIGR02757 family protein [Aquirufa sp.]
MISEKIATILDEKFAFFNHPRFIEHDPIQIPHSFSRLQDKEIMGFWVAILAWGQRKTILQNAHTLINLMDGAPYDFILHHQEADLKRFESFKHRTFQYPDTLYFIDFFKRHYSHTNSLESAFTKGLSPEDLTTENGLNVFYNYFFDSEWSPERTKKHIASPLKNSACKRINMFLRWMVRKDEAGVDFGLWNSIKPAQLVCPLDVHVMRTAGELGLMKEENANWKTALALTNTLRELDPTDPVKYDFALYGMGIEEKTLWK